VTKKKTRKKKKKKNVRRRKKKVKKMRGQDRVGRPTKRTETGGVGQFARGKGTGKEDQREKRIIVKELHGGPEWRERMHELSLEKGVRREGRDKESPEQDSGGRMQSGKAETSVNRGHTSLARLKRQGQEKFCPSVGERNFSSAREGGRRGAGKKEETEYKETCNIFEEYTKRFF